MKNYNKQNPKTSGLAMEPSSGQRLEESGEVCALKSLEEW